jgi:hypothetical protein
VVGTGSGVISLDLVIDMTDLVLCEERRQQLTREVRKAMLPKDGLPSAASIRKDIFRDEVLQRLGIKISDQAPPNYSPITHKIDLADENLLKSALSNLRTISSLIVTRDGPHVTFWRLTEEFKSFNSMSPLERKSIF